MREQREVVACCASELNFVDDATHAAVARRAERVAHDVHLLDVRCANVKVGRSVKGVDDDNDNDNDDADDVNGEAEAVGDSSDGHVRYDATARRHCAQRSRRR